MSTRLTIGELAGQAGMTTSTLRYYDELGLVQPIIRVAGQRRYEAQMLRRLRIIDLCKRAGFTLVEIRRLLDGAQEWRPLATAKLTELDQRIGELRDAKRLVQAALECDCDHLEGCERTAHDAPETICGTRPNTTREERA